MKRVPATVKDELKKAVKGKVAREPHLSELTQHFFAAAGGPRKVANMLFDEYTAAPAGGLVRQRILDIIFRATKYVNEKSGMRDDLGLLSEADLEAELETLLDEQPDGTQAPQSP